MLRLRSPQQREIWEVLIPADILELNDELKAIDGFLDDERFLLPYFRKHRTFNKLPTGRNSTPIESYIRLMYIKHRHQLSYETLIKEVSDSFKWRRFCRISLSDQVPDSTTLVKLTNLYGPELTKEINDELVKKLAEKKIIRGKKLRADCKAVEANIHYPTDSRLLGDGARVLNRLIKRLKASGVGIKVKIVEHTRVIKKSLRTLSKFKKLGEVKAKELCRTVVRHAGRTVRQAKAMCRAAGRALRQNRVRKSLGVAVDRTRRRLKAYVKATEKLLRQSKEVLKGNRHLPDRQVSVFNSKARPIVTGKQSKKTTFGRKVLVAEVEHGIISQCQALSGNPSETTLPKGLLDRHQKTFGRPPEEMATDRGMSSAKNERMAAKRGVKRVSMPARGKPSRKRKEYERQHWFKRLQRFRAGSEARLSCLARSFGFDRCDLTGDNGMENWTGWGTVAHNLWKTSKLTVPVPTADR